MSWLDLVFGVAIVVAVLRLWVAVRRLERSVERLGKRVDELGERVAWRPVEQEWPEEWPGSV